MIKSGKGRGDIDEHNNLKVLLPVGKLADDTMEGVFVKVIALHRNKKEGIGILENFPCWPNTADMGMLRALQGNKSKRVRADNGKG